MCKLRHSESGTALWLDQGRARVASEPGTQQGVCRKSTADSGQGGHVPKPRPLGFLLPCLGTLWSFPGLCPGQQKQALPGVVHVLAPAPASWSSASAIFTDSNLISPPPD